MPTFEELDELTTKELRERAFRAAMRRLDVRFFWNLIEAVPAAEAAAGHADEAEADVISLARQVEDALDPDSPEEEEALRPVYIDYLLERGEG